MSWWWTRRWILAWKMATHSGWTALSCRRTFIIRRTIPCYGMSYAWSLVWSAASKKQSRSGFGGSTIASGWHDVACKKSSGWRKVVEQTKKAPGKDLAAELAIPELRKEIEHYCKLGDRVIDQARRRVL